MIFLFSYPSVFIKLMFLLSIKFFSLLHEILKLNKVIIIWSFFSNLVDVNNFKNIFSTLFLLFWLVLLISFSILFKLSLKELKIFLEKLNEISDFTKPAVGWSVNFENLEFEYLLTQSTSRIFLFICITEVGDESPLIGRIVHEILYRPWVQETEFENEIFTVEFSEKKIFSPVTLLEQKPEIFTFSELGPKIPGRWKKKKSPGRAGVFKMREIEIVEFTEKISGENCIFDSWIIGITVIFVICVRRSWLSTSFWKVIIDKVVAIPELKVLDNIRSILGVSMYGSGIPFSFTKNEFSPISVRMSTIKEILPIQLSPKTMTIVLFSEFQWSTSLLEYWKKKFGSADFRKGSVRNKEVVLWSTSVKSRNKINFFNFLSLSSSSLISTFREIIFMPKTLGYEKIGVVLIFKFGEIIVKVGGNFSDTPVVGKIIEISFSLKIWIEYAPGRSWNLGSSSTPLFWIFQ